MPRAGSSSPPDSPTGNLVRGFACANRRIHPRSARVRVADGAAAGRDRARNGARPAAVRLPRHDAARERPGGRRPVRRRRRDGAPRRRRRGGAGRRLRRRARPPRDRADAAGAPARPGGRRGARRGGAHDAALRPLRGLRRADRHASVLGRDLGRAVRPLRRRAAGDGRDRRDRAAAARRARRGLGRARDVLAPSSTAASSTRSTRGRPSSADWGVPEVLLSGDHGRIEDWRREQSRARSVS